MANRVAVFHDGRIEQVGTPAEVYERPASAFVAGFVGTSNLLPPPVARDLIGQLATFSIRPEKITIVAEDHEPVTDEIVADGVVHHVSYGGATSRITVQLDAGPELTLLQRNETFQDAGASKLTGRSVRIAWGRRHAVRLPGSSEKEPGSGESASSESDHPTGSGPRVSKPAL